MLKLSWSAGLLLCTVFAAGVTALVLAAPVPKKPQMVKQFYSAYAVEVTPAPFSVRVVRNKPVE